MELKLANDENSDKKAGGLRLSGEPEQQEMRSQLNQENPWDFGRPEEPVVTRSISSTGVYDSSSYSSTVSDIHIVVKLGRIIIYACMLLMIITMLWVVTQPRIDIFFNIMKLAPLYSFCEIVFIVDVILVNVLYERKISLILWAWLFYPVYPLKRDKQVNGGSSWGGLVFAAMLIMLVVLGVNYVTAFTNYGAAILNGDKEVRNAVVEFMDSPVPGGGENYGSKPKNNFVIQNIDVETEGSQSVVIVQGNGQYGVDTDGFIDYTNKTAATQLAFVKDSSGNYSLGAVILGKTQLSNYYTEYYWNKLLR